MSKNRKITSQEFDYLENLEPILPKYNQEGYKSLKYKLLDAIEGVFGDKWHNLRPLTRQAIDYICFLSLDRGFVFASPDHIADKYKIGRSTVYEALKCMREEGLVVRANRCSRKQNGLGCQVLFLTIHPMFDHINSYLNLGWTAERKADWKAENAEIPCGTSDSADSDVSTFSLPSHHIKTIDSQSNVLTDASEPESKKKFIKYVPKEINEMFANLFDVRLRYIWQKITQAYKSINHYILTRDDLLHHGKSIIKRIYQIWKQHLKDGREMSIDEMCAFAYKSSRETFYNLLAEWQMEVYDENINERVWQKKDAVENIPSLEAMYVNHFEHDTLEKVREVVMKAIADRYDLLEWIDLIEIENIYAKMTTQFHLLSDYYRRMNPRLRAGIA